MRSAGLEFKRRFMMVDRDQCNKHGREADNLAAVCVRVCMCVCVCVCVCVCAGVCLQCSVSPTVETAV
jgi:hypothetical protein